MLLLTGKSAWNKKININLSHPFCPLTYAPKEASHESGTVAYHKVSCHVTQHVLNQCHQRMACDI